MQLQDGFIVGIYNYCDRWCEACAFTSRCRSFAMMAEVEARLDRSFEDVIPPREQAAEVAEQIVEIQRSTQTPTRELALLLRPEHRYLEARAKAYAFHAARWLGDHAHADVTEDGSRSDPLAVLARYLFFIPGKVFRGLTDLSVADEREDLDDADGSAKAALLAAEESCAAWRALVANGRVTALQAEPFVAELEWLCDELARVFPKARTFVRPAFDEPDEVARLVQQEA